MVDRSATCTDPSPSGDDFEWVNAWAESAISGEPKGEPSPLETESKTCAVSVPIEPQAANEVPTTAPVLAAPEEAALFPAAAPALAEVESIEPEAADDRVEAAEPQVAEDNVDVLALDDMTARAEALDPSPAKAPTWLKRNKWTRLLRIVARNPKCGADLPAALPKEPADALSIVADEADTASRAPEHVELAPDQLERDIAEIELIRDRLLAEPEARTVSCDEVTAAAPSRTSDQVPILVGGALAFTLLVVFGAAASLVSLR